MTAIRSAHVLSAKWNEHQGAAEPLSPSALNDLWVVAHTSLRLMAESYAAAPEVVYQEGLKWEGADNDYPGSTDVSLKEATQILSEYPEIHLWIERSRVADQVVGSRIQTGSVLTMRRIEYARNERRGEGWLQGEALARELQSILDATRQSLVASGDETVEIGLVEPTLEQSAQGLESTRDVCALLIDILKRSGWESLSTEFDSENSPERISLWFHSQHPDESLSARFHANEERQTDGDSKQTFADFVEQLKSDFLEQLKNDFAQRRLSELLAEVRTLAAPLAAAKAEELSVIANDATEAVLSRMIPEVMANVTLDQLAELKASTTNLGPPALVAVL